MFEETTCQSLAKMLENCLSKSKQTKLGCSKVLVPENLTQRIAQDVLRLSSTEPCGLRGCVMHVNLEIENVCKKLDRIVCDSSVVPTFELTLVFKQENCSWTSFKDFFFSRGRFSSGLRRTLILSSGFRLVKRKLYSLIGTTVIEECWKGKILKVLLGLGHKTAQLPRESRFSPPACSQRETPDWVISLPGFTFIATQLKGWFHGFWERTRESVPFFAYITCFYKMAWNKRSSPL